MNKPLVAGHHHPTILVFEEVIAYFRKHNFQVALGPEIETEWFNFDFLRVPSDHPARDAQDTFWTKDGRVLRTHATTMQGRITTDWNIAPPLRVISPGRVFRNESTDASHEAVLHQIDAFVIDKNIRMSHLLATIQDFLKTLYGDVEVRFRPHAYRFVEPGMDIDMKWKNKWLEMGGSGMIHPEVIQNMGLDPKIYSGFAFGMGADRLAMLKYGIQDVRQLHNNIDLRLINQF